MTVRELKMLWEPAAQGKITRWSQIRAGWPDKEIHLFGAGVDSGTYDYFTEAIVGTEHASRGDFTASEDDNVLVQGIASDINALGFFGYAYYAENTDKLKAVGVDPGNGKPVLPSEKTVLDASYQPLSRPIFMYVNAASLAKPEVKEFVEFYLKNAAELAKEVKYVPLPPTAYVSGMSRLAKMETGTVFGGHSEIGVKIEDLFTRELKH
jgi:phosphate transport system substrate-binding protein